MFFPSPREGGEKVPEGRMRGFAVSQRLRPMTPHEELPAFAGRRKIVELKNSHRFSAPAG